jgi:NAD(P)-dependent dehydrogenase (short-subunit alcohol dehydrogenase family)
MDALKEKIVLVTGGGRGIGRSIALAFAGKGSRVVVSGRNQSDLNAVAGEIRSLGTTSLPIRCDVTRKDDIASLYESINKQLGAVQILVNNAGVAVAAGFLEMDDQLWEDVLKVNLDGAYHCCKVFLPAMIASRWGRIINIASTTAKVGYSHTAAYTTSKHALLGLTRALAMEFAKTGVTVNAICPGYVDTERTHDNARLMAEKTGKKVEEVLALFRGSSPQHRLIESEEIADVALMLASRAADGITGQAINVDGGAVMV